MGIHRKDAADLRGLIIPDSRIDYLTAFSATDSTITEASPHAGVPEPLADSDMSLETSGSQSAAKDLRIKTQSPGHVDGPGARFIWQQTTGTDTNQKGWNPPGTGLRGVEIVDNGATYAGTTPGRTSIISLQDGSMIAASKSDSAIRLYWKKTTDSYWSRWAPLFPDTVKMAPLQGARNNWIPAGLAPFYYVGSAAASPTGPALVELPSGRVLCIFWAQNGNLRSVKSDDKGETWTLHSDHLLQAPNRVAHTGFEQITLADGIHAVKGPLKAAYKDGQILLVSSIVRTDKDSGAVAAGSWTGSNRDAGNTWLQMASSDLGATFDIVDYGDGTENQNGVGFDITTVNGEFLIAFLRNARNLAGPPLIPLGDVVICKLGSAYQRLSNSTFSSFNNANGPFIIRGDDDGDIPLAESWTGHTADARIYDYELAIASSPDGNVYLAVCGLGYRSRTGDAIQAAEWDKGNWQSASLFVSNDAGVSFHVPGYSWFSDPDTAVRPAVSTHDPLAPAVGGPRGGEFFHAGGQANTAANLTWDRLRDFSLCWNRGQLICFTGAQGTTDAENPQEATETLPEDVPYLFTLHMGGYSDLVRSHNEHPLMDHDRSNMRFHYVPFTTPDNHALASFWGAVKSGVNAANLIWDAPSVNNKPRLEITAGDGAGAVGVNYFQHVVTESAARHVLTTAADAHGQITDVDFACFVHESTVGRVAIQSGAPLTTGAGTPNNGTLIVNLRNTSIILQDLNGPMLDTFTLNSLGLAYPIQIRARVGTHESGSGYRWFVWASNYEPDATVRKWVKVNAYDEPGSAHLVAGFGGTNECDVKWGFSSGGGVTQEKMEFYFMMAGASTEDTAGKNPENGWQTPGDALDLDDYTFVGRRISSVPVYVDDGVRLAGKDGPAVRGNEWQIKTRYDYGVENIHHEINASPDAVWRSTSDSNQIEIAWKVGPSSSAGGFSLNRVYGLYLGNINFKTAYLDVQADGSTSWTQVAEIDAADGMTGLSFDRKGNAIRPNTATIAAGQYFPYNILAGSHVALNTGGATTYHPIETNSEGSFTGVATKRTTIRIGGDFAAASAGGAAVLCDIWSKETVALFHQMDTAHKIRLRIPAQTTAEGYFQIGAFIAGSVALFGRQHSRGHMREIRTNTDLTTQRSGVRRASVHGKARRAVELSWDDSVDISEMQNAAPAPDFVSTMYGAIAGDPAHQHGVFNDGPTLVKGVLEATDGSSVPVVYLSRIPATDYDSGVVTSKFADRSEFLMGRIVSTKYRVENVLGDDSLNEVVTGTTIRIDEEL